MTLSGHAVKKVRRERAAERQDDFMYFTVCISCTSTVKTGTTICGWSRCGCTSWPIELAEILALAGESHAASESAWRESFWTISEIFAMCSKQTRESMK